MRIFPPLRRLKKYLLAFLFLLALKIPWAFLLSQDGTSLLQGRGRRDVISRRNYLIDKVLHKGATVEDMPSHLGSQFQGEWALVTYSMLSAGLTNLAHIYSETHSEALNNSRALIEIALHEDVRRFDRERWGEDPLESLNGNNGHIGYLGHLNWMLSAYEFLGGEAYRELFDSVSAALARRLRSSGGLCLPTYRYEIYYVPDNVVVIASLANYSRLRNGRLRDSVDNWLLKAKALADSSDSGLLPFHLSPSCEAVGEARGSGVGWNSFYLPFIDREFAEQQYRLLKKEFLQTRIITGIREYRHGVWGIGDVDSGPVIFGFSPSGTGFTVGGAMHAGDAELLSKLMFTSELAGSSIQWGRKRFYLAAPLVGEAIMLAMKTATVWDGRFVKSSSTK